MNSRSVPIISVVGWANTGKTTFLEKLVTEFKARGRRVGVIKHHRGAFDIDRPGKDTWRLARAGAACTAITGSGRVGLVLEFDGDPTVEEVVALMPGMDLIITEGYKQAAFPQLEVRRAGYGENRPASRPGQLVAVVGARSLCTEDVPCFDPEDAAAVADFIEEKFSRWGIVDE
jgi:molybdopterin-guanine dinucleotide biosynthesis protein B